MPSTTDTKVLYCDENLERLAQLPEECVDLAAGDRGNRSAG